MPISFGGESFIDSVFLRSGKTILEWNNNREPNEQAKLFRFLSLLYRYFRKQSRLLDDGIQCYGEEDINESIMQTPTGSSISDWITRKNASISKPNKRVGEDQQSSVTGSSFTHFSNLSKTTVKTEIESRNSYLTDFKFHKRALAVNRRQWNPKMNNQPSVSSSPIFPPAIPASRSQSVVSVHSRWNQQTLGNVFRHNRIAEIKTFLASLPVTDGELCTSVLRSLQAERRYSHYDTSSSIQNSWLEESRTNATSSQTRYLPETFSYDQSLSATL